MSKTGDYAHSVEGCGLPSSCGCSLLKVPSSCGCGLLKGPSSCGCGILVVPSSCVYVLYASSCVCVCALSRPGQFVIPVDPSLTSSSVLTALETVHDLYHVKGILGVRGYAVSNRLRAQHANDADYRTALVEHYLKTSPYTSWRHLGGCCLYEGEESALSVCQRNMQHDEGMGDRQCW